MKNKLFLLCLWVLTVPVQAQSISRLSEQQAQVEKQRKALQTQIEQLNKQINAQESNRRDVLSDLREAESTLSTMERKLDRLLDQEQAAKDDLVDIRQEEKTQQQVLQSVQEELSEQLYLQYTNDLSPWSALLSGQDVQKISRDLSYLGYVSKARTRTVATLNKEVDRLAQVRKKAQERQKHLTKLTKEAKQAKLDLEKEQKSYHQKLAKIEGDIKQRRQKASTLKEDDARLNQLITQIEKNIRQQREALRRAEIERQKQAEARRKAMAEERKRQAEKALAQAKAAQEQAEKAKALREKARQSQLQAIEEQRRAIERVQKAEMAVNRAVNPVEQKQARGRLQQALSYQELTKLSLDNARQQAEDAEIERAKAKMAQEKARESQRLLQKAKEDEKLASAAASTDISAVLKKGAPWPLRGRLLGRFGQTRPDTGSAWNGILIESSAGAAVKAIASGQVVFASWVRGFGNLIIVDHGQDMLSVYGYNQSLSYGVGDNVRVGQTIARAGSTGGQVEPALYFEIRQGSRPVDPLQWLAK
ncbi:peptidoglycan DD-metalloendopeptidase family protein [Pelistega sp. NLN82]|uniref:Peptidoglycan DD-metalloendopeptidase family protein n=1 Tax=Pelistega ratti TaxID=2652177 RepID=A0A6L9Y6T2_9BURK|nr:peptidoglycan DD-metalloendopeptidase family protein [Pelistega ratti]NEN76026.1 peptidoglycan DD-metalloendopeptidase family protein [Pelistega ratti]